ncbi:Fe2+-dependent dioxygenase [Acetobacter conturbans]|uniref:Fe2+-dependent dioxygenase n=1 Tax=Acetobacter conturbans TaxID=1737472 RepID=A0ABX0JW49_9PROT|nr:Fe2+-dependent dioxygenase [Acetobacter conturbans]NHN87706.1 Fe2+-dependent dioxygenase [Acetobacter conturbans]
MPAHIPNLLSPDQIAEYRPLIEAGNWIDGRTTAGVQASHAKHNLQLAADCENAGTVRNIILQALSANLLFRGFSLPRTIFPPMFNRYDGGMTYGAHVDNSVQVIPGSGGQMMRADLSATIFFNDPEDYEGGELELETASGTEMIKLPAGDMIIYPTTMIHCVTPVTKGSRLASFFWIQSLVADHASRTLLFSLDRAIIDLRARTEPNDPAILSLTNTYHNLVRRWCDL